MGNDAIKVTVRFFGLLDAIPESRVLLVLPGEATLATVLQTLAERFGSAATERMIHRDGRLRDDIKLIIGAEVIDRLDHKLERDTTVFVLSQFAGGS